MKNECFRNENELKKFFSTNTQPPTQATNLNSTGFKFEKKKIILIF